MNICERHDNAVVVFDYPTRDCPLCKMQEEWDEMASEIKDVEDEKEELKREVRGLELERDLLQDNLDNSRSQVEKLKVKIEELKNVQREP